MGLRAWDFPLRERSSLDPLHALLPKIPKCQPWRPRWLAQSYRSDSLHHRVLHIGEPLRPYPALLVGKVRNASMGLFSSLAFVLPAPKVAGRALVAPGYRYEVVPAKNQTGVGFGFWRRQPARRGFPWLRRSNLDQSRHRRSPIHEKRPGGVTTAVETGAQSSEADHREQVHRGAREAVGRRRSLSL